MMIPGLVGIAGFVGGGGVGINYRYYRINVSNAQGTTNVLIAESELLFESVDLVPLMTSATTSSVTVSTSAESGGREGFKAFNDSNVSPSQWSAGAAPVQWIKVDFGSNTTLDAYSIESRSDSNIGSPEDWTFEGSNDDSSWDVLDTQTGEVFGANDRREYPL
ncbi:MAG: discoidin domain-containing protein [Hyphomicrobiales bacterium]|nr:discoidin domain-containing protein [Hyphomicrobiales bacterium]